MKENSIEDRIEEKYTKYKNCETDILELTIEEAIFILEKNASVHYVEDLLQEAYKVILSDYKRVLKINEVLLKENEEIRIKNNAIKRESEAYAENMIRLDNELKLEKEKEKSKYEWIIQNCLPQELVNKLYIPLQKIKDNLIKYQEEYELLLEHQSGKESNRTKYLRGRIHMCQELLESEE